VPRVRAAIVGTGNIAGYHIASLKALGDEVEAVAGVDVDGRRVEDFCSEHAIAGRYTDLEEMLETERPELVHVCTPPSLHHEQALACLRAGASVLVEKPPTLSLRELDELAEAEREGGPWVATVFQHRFGSGARRLRALIEDGVLGAPLLAICHTTWFRDQAYFDVAWRGRWDTEGGGPTMGHGIHQIDLLSAVLGEWTEVSAVVRRQAREMDTEDLSLAHVAFASGAVASVVNSVLSPREETYLRFDFERATVELTHLYGYADADWRITPAPGHEAAVGAAWAAGAAGVRSGHRAQLGAVLESLRGGTAPPVTTADVRRTMELVAAVYASAFQRCAIGPDDLEPGSPFYERMNGDGPPWELPRERLAAEAAQGGTG
jgi:predicted dehydrogenase